MNLSYFETFHKLKSKDQIDEEYGSMSLTSSIETWCDHRKWIFEDIRVEVLSLLTDLAATIHVGPQSEASSLILRRFNDEEIFSAIIYYFRLLANEFLKANSVTEQDFNPDGLGVSICKDMLEPLNTEIENLGVTILIDVLMNPMSIAVEIVYRDRSGTHVNSHLVRAEDDNGILINPARPIVRLLYRPGQYDILYKYTNASRSLRQQQIIDSASAASNIQINRASVFDRALDPSPMTNFNSANLPGTVDIPGLSMAALSNHGFPSTYTPLSDYEPILTSAYPFDTSASTQNMQYVPPISAVSPHDSGTPIVPAAALSIHSAPSRPQRTRNLKVKPIEVPPSSLGNQFRHSKYEYDSDWNDPSAQIFQTSMFKNSHYNTAHYSNPNFQPEEWSPDDEGRSRAPRRFGESQVDVHGSL
jgi:ubiquitin thioesterase protein OTUB1